MSQLNALKFAHSSVNFALCLPLGDIENSRGMTFLDLLGHFLSIRFPFWGICHISFLPRERAIYLHCSTPEKRLVICRDRAKLAKLDIGVQRIIVRHPGYPDYVIETAS